jgi:hypothetical protein
MERHTTGLERSKLLLVPLDVIREYGKQFRVQRNRPALSARRFGAAHRQILLGEVELRLGQLLDLSIAHSGIEGQRQREIDVG